MRIGGWWTAVFAALAVTGAGRSDAFPDLPAIGEFCPGYEMAIWLGLFAPAGTPGDVLARLRQGLATVLVSPGVREKLHAAGGLQPLTMPPADFTAMIARDSSKYQRLVKDIGAKID